MLIGHVRGGMGQVNILTSVMMGGLSGSANADAAMSTKIIVPEMTRAGYGKGFSTALTAAASCITPIVLLLLINVLLLVIGTFFEGGAAMIIMAPLFVPVILAMGIDPIHFGIVMAINLVLGGFTPPVGTMMFITITIANVKIIDYVKECWPFLLALLAVLLLVTCVPAISLYLPDVLL